jgi:hypothetical protein
MTTPALRELCRGAIIFETFEETCSSPGTPKDRVKILEEAIGKGFADGEFHKEYQKIVGDDADPIMPEAMAKVVKETPRDPEVIETLKKLSGARSLPTR